MNNNPRPLVKIMAEVAQILVKLAGKTPSLIDIDYQLLWSKINLELGGEGEGEGILEAAAQAAAYISITPDYAFLAGRISSYLIQQEVERKFWENLLFIDRGGKTPTAVNGCYQDYDFDAGIFRPEVMRFARKYRRELEEIMDPERDFTFDYFGISTLKKSYLIKFKAGVMVETPQYLFMRVALGIHATAEATLENLNQVQRTYEMLSQHKIIHASPTLFNCGLKRGQLSSCFLLPIAGDSLDSIFDTVKDVAMISKGAGGIGLSVQNVRGSGARLGKTDGVAGGLVPMLKVFNELARYVDQGGGKRKGAITVYLEPWHPDTMNVLAMKSNQGSEELKARDLFYALWVPDLFMKRVEARESWSFFMPHECPELYDTWGEEFEAHYHRLEKAGRATSTLPARDIFEAIIRSQVETGGPFILYKDHANRKSNHQNLGTIRSSNLCTEIIQYSSSEEVATCNLASISLPSCLKLNPSTGVLEFSYDELASLTKQLVINLNRVIDVTHYTVPAASHSNLKHRPMAIGVQGLADVFMRLGLPFTSDEARGINRQIFQCIYYAALRQSVDLAIEYGPYSSYDGSPLSKGIIQPDMWNVTELGDWNWVGLRADLARYGARNSLLVGPMPTATTSQILGNMECFEPQTSNLYTRRVLAGEFVVINRHLIKDLINLGVWTPRLHQEIIHRGGSVQGIPEIPTHLQEVYLTVWEIRQRLLANMSADRAPFIDQSQSFSIYMETPNFEKMAACHFHTWRLGLKTGMYYLRTRPAADPIKFTLSEEPLACRRDDPTCLTCSS